MNVNGEVAAVGVMTRQKRAGGKIRESYQRMADARHCQGEAHIVWNLFHMYVSVISQAVGGLQRNIQLKTFSLLLSRLCVIRNQGPVYV